MAKREILLKALHAYADSYDPEGDSLPGNEVVDRCVEFLEAICGLDLGGAPAGKTYSYAWLLQTLHQLHGAEAPAHCAIGFLLDLGLIREELINFEEPGNPTEVAKP